jgi:hypothetical protein
MACCIKATAQEFSMIRTRHVCAQPACEHMYRTDVNMHAQSRDEYSYTHVQKWDVTNMQSDLHAK